MIRSIHAALVCGVLLSCGLTEPTYIDIPEKRIEALSNQLGVDLSTALAENRRDLKAELSEELGLVVDRLFVKRVEGLSDEFASKAQEILAQEGLDYEDVAGALSASGISDEFRSAISDELATRLDALIEANRELRTAFVAEIEPASEAAAKEVGTAVMDDPADPSGWAPAGLAGAFVLLSGLLGLRGRAKKSKKSTRKTS